WLRGSAGRFGYNYAIGRWSEFDPSPNNSAWWQTLSAQCRPVIFVGSGTLTDLGTGWGFVYDYNNDSGLWAVNGAARYAYNYTKKQWTDYTSQGWAALSRNGLRSSKFIGNGEWYELYIGDFFRGDGDSYCWTSGGHERYRYEFASGSWSYWTGSNWSSLTYNGAAQNPDCRYLYNALFVERGLRLDEGDHAPAGRQELWYQAYDYASGGHVLRAWWKIHNPGADKKWSGSDLNVAWGTTRHWNSIESEWMDDVNQHYGEFTKEDVVFFAEDFEYYPIGFARMVSMMTLVRDYYGKQIRTVQVAANGDATGWFMGEWMDRWNYASFQTDWERWRGLVTTDAQIVSLHSQVGCNSPMLIAIGGWSGCAIYANTNITYTWCSWLYGSGDLDWVWNGNYDNVTWYDNSPTSIQRSFELSTTASPNYRWLFSL
ncbi:MAG: hypothetical protein HY912_02430, partial [Desulfomonile tiedjei]|nr:hypothetical protein [Desulfomonile tiedjei]